MMTAGARPQRPEPPTPPSPFFDGTRLGLEAAMGVTLVIGISAGLHTGLSAALGYLVRYADGLPDGAQAFSLAGFLFTSLLTVLALCVLLFFSGAVPVMAYSVVLVFLMLRWAAKLGGRAKALSTLFGGVLGSVTGLLVASLWALLTNVSPTWALYGVLVRWPKVMSVDGVALLWITLLPLAHAAAGAQIGWRLGKLLDDWLSYRFW